MNLEPYIAKSLELAKLWAETYGPVAWDVARTIVRIQALQELLIGLVAIAIIFAAVKVNLKVYEAGKVWAAGKRYPDMYGPPDYGPFFVSAFTGGLISVLCVIVIAATLLDLWNWIALFYPDIAIAYRLFNKVL